VSFQSLDISWKLLVTCDTLSDAVQGALMSSHVWLTVSQSYAHGIVQDPSAGCGLHDLLNTRGVRYAPS